MDTIGSASISESAWRVPTQTAAGARPLANRRRPRITDVTYTSRQAGTGEETGSGCSVCSRQCVLRHGTPRHASRQCVESISIYGSMGFGVDWCDLRWMRSMGCDVRSQVVVVGGTCSATRPGLRDMEGSR